MNARISYAAALQYAATTADAIAHQYPWKREAKKHLRYAAALRELARLVEEAERQQAEIVAGKQPGSNFSGVVAALAAGYRPGAGEGGR